MNPTSTDLRQQGEFLGQVEVGPLGSSYFVDLFRWRGRVWVIDNRDWRARPPEPKEWLAHQEMTEACR